MATPEERMFELAGGPPRAPQEPPNAKLAYNEAADKMIQKASTGGIGDESIADFMRGLSEHGRITKDEHTQIMEGFAKQGQNLVIGPPAAMAGGAADVVSLATLLLYNGLKAASGEETAWPENFNDVPLTSDFWGSMLGAETTSLAFIASGIVVDPAKAGKYVNKALNVAKALKGSKKAQIARRESAEKMLADGVDRVTVWKETGWFKDPHGILRFAISDADAKLKLDSIWTVAQKQHPDAKLHDLITIEARPDQIIDHPALFELYPTAAGNKMTIQLRVAKDGDGNIQYRPSAGVGSAGNQGSFRPSNHEIGITSHRPVDSIIHELQHKIDAISDIGAGHSWKVVADTAHNFRHARIMKGVLLKQKEYSKQNLTQGQWKDVLLKAGIREDRVEYAANQAKWYVEMNDEGVENALRLLSKEEDRYAKQTARWLNEIEYQHGEKGIKEAIEKLSEADIESLAWERYIGDSEEVTARISQALKHLPQELLDDLPADPYDLQQWLTPQVARDLDAEGFTNIESMRHPQKLSKIVSNKDVVQEDYIDLSKNKLPPLEPYKVDPKFKSQEIRDVYLKPKYLLTEDKVRVEYLKNPSESELKKWVTKKYQHAPKDEAFRQLRYMKDTEGNVHIWDANEALHPDFVKAVGAESAAQGQASLDDMLWFLKRELYKGEDALVR